MRNALCLLTKIPNITWLEFLNNFKDYDVFIIIDDNTNDYNKIYDNKYRNINIIQIENTHCYKNGYTNCNSAVGFPDVISWDKALYLIGEIKKEYEHIWLIEDDVFLYDENVLKNIDKKYEKLDLLSAFNHINHANVIDSWNQWWNHWVNIYDKIDLPWAHSMVCACRISRTLLNKIIEYKNKKGQLFFIEAMFNTISLHENLSIANPIELNTIHWKTDWELNKLDMNKLYHPIKEFEDHKKIRNHFSK
jgi:hypothetical protein